MKEFSVLFRDDSLIVANKTTPIPAQPEKSGDESLQELLALAEAEGAGKAPAYLEAAHRIDRRASGIVVFARNGKAAAALSEAFREGRVKKTYLAVVDREPDPPEGRLEHDIAWDPRVGKARIADGREGAERLEFKKSSLAYRVAAKSERYVLLEINLETGRTHQIRAQLAAIGLPVRGDLKYGARRSTKNGMIMLHSWKIEFSHPDSGQGLSFTAPPPDSDSLWRAFPGLAGADGSDPDGAAGEGPG